MTVKVQREVSLDHILAGSGTSNKTTSTKGTTDTDLNAYFWNKIISCNIDLDHFASRFFSRYNKITLNGKKFLQRLILVTKNVAISRAEKKKYSEEIAHPLPKNLNGRS